jgi:manganese/iron transport system substrate-binding protein
LRRKDGAGGFNPPGSDPHAFEQRPQAIAALSEADMVFINGLDLEEALAQADPENASTYQDNAEAYIVELQELDGWISECVSQIPPRQRKLVTVHAFSGYFADQYDFEQVGLIIPSLSTGAAPSAQELATLVSEIREQGVKAIFVGKSASPALAEQAAAETGAAMVFVYSGSLGESGSEAENYLDFMRYNVNLIRTR